MAAVAEKQMFLTFISCKILKVNFLLSYHDFYGVLLLFNKYAS